MNDLLTIDRRSIWHPFSSLGENEPLPLITSAKGIYLNTHDGRQIIDAISSWWVNIHGHANPFIAGAIARQAASLEHVIFAGFTHEPAIHLSERLLNNLPDNYQKIFFSDNGSTAVEVAIKMAIQYWHNQGISRRRIIAIQGAYHGDTFGSMSVADRGLFTQPFHPLLFDTAFIDFPTDANAAEVKKQFINLIKQGDVAAFIFEPLVQAAAGMRMYSASLLDELIQAAHAAEVLCIADEVFTGFGRTGKNFATDYLQAKPDLIAVSKGITGGFLPLGATACSGKITKAFDTSERSKTFFHGHSYTANPIACAAAVASWDLLISASCQSKMIMIGDMHREFASRVSHFPAVLETRQQGTILAIELKTTAARGYENPLRKKIYPWFLERNILIRPLGNVLYVLPPYVIEAGELKRIYDAVEGFLTELEKENH